MDIHPRSGETVAVLGSKRHAGAEHFVVRQPDRTLALLPAWMTEFLRGGTNSQLDVVSIRILPGHYKWAKIGCKFYPTPIILPSHGCLLIWMPPPEPPFIQKAW
jgi:hypothetical protein